jgi:DNA repair protein RecO (recombination protein O)
MTRWVGEAIVLRTLDLGESDRIVRLLTPASGRVGAIAKGARRSVRRFPGTLDLFNRLRVQVDRRGRGMARLEQATLLHAFPALRRDARRFALACYLVEVVDRLAPEGGVPRDAARLFAFARDALSAVEVLEPDARTRVLLELRALDALGLRPELRRCVRCGREPPPADRVAFHVAEGGLLCGGCAARAEGLLQVHPGTLRALEQALHFDLRRLERLGLGRVALVEARALLARFQRFHVGVELRSERFLDEMLAAPRAGAGLTLAET